MDLTEVMWICLAFFSILLKIKAQQFSLVFYCYKYMCASSIGFMASFMFHGRFYIYFDTFDILAKIITAEY